MSELAGVPVLLVLGVLVLLIGMVFGLGLGVLWCEASASRPGAYGHGPGGHAPAPVPPARSTPHPGSDQ